MNAQNVKRPLQIDENKNSFWHHPIGYLFLLMSMIPFLFPLPFVTTNMQPYAAMIATVVVIFGIPHFITNNKLRLYFIISGLTLVFAVFVMLFNQVNKDALRGIYNYYAVVVIPLATAVVIKRIGYFPEKFYKFIILLWFGVCFIQFFFYRGFLVQLIGSANWTSKSRGVIGLSSEPSFLGIVCFYFLHIIRYFKTRRLLYFSLVLIMGILFAQSALGILFIAVYVAVFGLESINSKRGLAIWIAIILAVVLFIILLNTTLKNTRLYQLYSIITSEGVNNLVEVDVSSGNRMSSILSGWRQFVSNWFMPTGFGKRYGSGVFGFLCELGVFAVPVISFIAYAMSLTFKKKIVSVIYFIAIIGLLANNTQMGHPILLTVVGLNLFFADPENSAMLAESSPGAQKGGEKTAFTKTAGAK